MAKKHHVLISDLQGITKIGADAVVHASHVIEAFQRQIVHPSFLPTTPIQRLVSGISAGVHKTLRFTAKGVGKSAQHALNLLDQERSTGIRFEKKRAMLAVINGVVGDYLSRNNNPLAQPMQINYRGEPINNVSGIALPENAPVNGKILLLIHGLCMDDLCWTRGNHNHGEALAEALQMTPLYLRYNTGLHVSDNGATLSSLVEALLDAWPVPVEELVIVGHSMGGLVVRSAVQQAGHHNKSWVSKLGKIVFLGTPHQGTTLEKVGNYVHALLHNLPYTKPLAKLGGLRSAGITDLRFGNLVKEDWEKHDRFAKHSDVRQPINLPEKIRCYAIAATLGENENDLKSCVAGDGLVPLESALGKHENPAQQLVFAGNHTLYKTGHMDLLSSQSAYKVLKDWLLDGNERCAAPNSMTPF